MVNKQIFQLIDFARRLPHFPKLAREDQVMLVKCGWNEVLIASVAFRSVEVGSLKFKVSIQSTQCLNFSTSKATERAQTWNRS